MVNRRLRLHHGGVTEAGYPVVLLVPSGFGAALLLTAIYLPVRLAWLEAAETTLSDLYPVPEDGRPTRSEPHAASVGAVPGAR